MNSSRFFSPSLVMITAVLLFSGVEVGAQDYGETKFLAQLT
jgi:hypothetical protein